MDVPATGTNAQELVELLKVMVRAMFDDIEINQENSEESTQRLS
jgi:hypothetical protein